MIYRIPNAKLGARGEGGKKNRVPALVAKYGVPREGSVPGNWGWALLQGECEISAQPVREVLMDASGHWRAWRLIIIIVTVCLCVCGFWVFAHFPSEREMRTQKCVCTKTFFLFQFYFLHFHFIICCFVCNFFFPFSFWAVIFLPGVSKVRQNSLTGKDPTNLGTLLVHVESNGTFWMGKVGFVPCLEEKFLLAVFPLFSFCVPERESSCG